MTEPTSRRSFLVHTSSTAAALAVSGSLVACGDSSATASEFKYGVASGDPLSTSVILWTHAKIAGSTSSVGLTWQIASDRSFSTLLQSGRLQASEATSFTAKVDVTGLVAGSSYFYRFIDDAGVASAVGTTRTLPASNATSVKLAVFSCALYSEGYFNTYDAAAKSDAQYAIHLGDYIYEYGADPTKFGNTDAVALGRVTSPANDIVSLSDYRTRYALYRADPNLQALHARMPMIAVWDDHEFANNAYVGGAENHKSATQGDWLTRKNNAAKAYHEWMPIRTPDASNLLKIYRKFDFGNLLSLYMLDTRIEGRDQQYDNFGDADGGIARYIAGVTPASDGTLPDASRKMISATQQNWLSSGFAASTATWQFLGNQDIMARMWFPASVLQAQATAATNPAAVSTAIGAYLTAKATRFAAGAAALTPTQAALLSSSTNPRIPYNLDSWDGYPANREAIFQTAKAQGKKLVALSGDSHNAWFTNLTTLAGDKVGVEFATSSVSAPGFESAGLGGLASSLDGSALVPQLGNAAIGAGLGLIDDLNYSDTTRRGYLQVTVTAAAVKGEFIFVSTVKSTSYSVVVGKTITVASTGAVTYA
ncbi:alkaline phosphatase D [Rhodoferax sp. OV413]|uniref:alkaline phosphatase D family protein n=1 Tax=Rhodoferax sp. OV413 TaxID=1855285 RepID=UPI000881E3D9|nr:alkaline phosphatase D family protein [Rhodoferax sp. OV413]SDO30330.1 alkaline phosphatase D [Rhodoferax sp. OV413]